VRYTPRIKRLVSRALGPDSEREDLLHEILLTVFTQAGSVRNPACLDSWVTQVSLNIVRGALRRRSRRPLARSDAEVEIPSRPADIEARDAARRVLDVMIRLPPTELELLEHHWLGDLSVVELALREGCSSATVRRRLQRARARFHRLARRDPLLAVRLRGRDFEMERPR
jgi:RNA polymerase sigma-70 factor (ECF subfamily)